MYDCGLRPNGFPDGTDDIDVVDLFHARNVVNAADPALLDAAHNDVAEVSHIQRLPQILSITGNGEYGHPLHEA